MPAVGAEDGIGAFEQLVHRDPYWLDLYQVALKRHAQRCRALRWRVRAPAASGEDDERERQARVSARSATTHAQ